MPHDPRKFLHDMRRACELLLRFTKSKTFEEYQADPLLRSAVERQCQIVGEGLYQLEKQDPELAARVPRSRDIINFRHVLVHGYHMIDDEVVWGTVKSNIPELFETLGRLLEES